MKKQKNKFLLGGGDDNDSQNSTNALTIDGNGDKLIIMESRNKS